MKYMKKLLLVGAFIFFTCFCGMATVVQAEGNLISYSYTDLTPGREYMFFLLHDGEVDPFMGDNIIYMDQNAADSTGMLTFTVKDSQVGVPLLCVADSTPANMTRWSLDAEGALVIYETSGKSDYCESAPAPWTGIPVTSVEIRDGVTAIGANSFNACTDLTQIFIPASLTSIGENAFFGCSKLDTIDYTGSKEELGTLIDGIGNGNEALISLIEKMRNHKVYGNLTAPETEGDIIIQLFGEERDTPLYSIQISGTATEYAFESVAKGTYTLVASKYGCTTLETQVTVDNADYRVDLELEVLPVLRFSGASLDLQSNLTINYRVSASLLNAGYTNLYAKFVFNGKEYLVEQYSLINDEVVFSFRNIAAQYMGDVVTATLYGTYNGEEYSSKSVNYSILQYCNNMLSRMNSDSYTDFRTLLVDLLNYGSSAQEYQSYKTDELVNQNLTEVQKSWATNSTPEINNNLNTKYNTVNSPSVLWRGANLDLRYSITVRLLFITESTDGLRFKVESGSDVWWIEASEILVSDNGLYMIAFDKLNAGRMRNLLYITAYKDGKAVSNTVQYSIESYAASQSTGANTKLVNLLINMMKYGDSARRLLN